MKLLLSTQLTQNRKIMCQGDNCFSENLVKGRSILFNHFLDMEKNRYFVHLM